MSDVLTLIDRQLQYKQEAAERYTGRARLAIKTDIETLKRAREEILRLEDLAQSWEKRAAHLEVTFIEMNRSIDFLKDQWEHDAEFIMNLINNVASPVEEVVNEIYENGRKRNQQKLKEYEPKRPY